LVLLRWVRDTRTRVVLLEQVLGGHFAVQVDAAGQVAFQALPSLGESRLHLVPGGRL
jgi:hypothetical protein